MVEQLALPFDEARSRTERAFLRRLAELGATPLYQKWSGVLTRYKVRCCNGHECWPLPASVKQGTGICRTCAGNDPAVGEARFRTRLEELGAVPLYLVWRGVMQPHRIRCSKGHVRDVRPNTVLRKDTTGICRTCTGIDPERSEATFLARLAELGAVPLYQKWEGAANPHRVRCPKGHVCYPRPTNTKKGLGVCLTCAGQNQLASEARFRARIATLGGEVLEPTWRGVDSPHRARCANGHECRPRPSDIERGQGICVVCAGHDPAFAEAKFRKLLAEQDATPLFQHWNGAILPHPVLCRNGHLCYPTPASVSQGQGCCRRCVGKIWDVFYVVSKPTSARVKVGVTSHDARSRLYDHSRHGYRSVHFVGRVTGADVLEREVLQTLAAHGIRPVRGREYFDADLALPTILRVVQAWVDDGRLLVESTEQAAS